MINLRKKPGLIQETYHELIGGSKQDALAHIKNAASFKVICDGAIDDTKVAPRLSPLKPSTHQYQYI